MHHNLFMDLTVSVIFYIRYNFIITSMDCMPFPNIVNICSNKCFRIIFSNTAGMCIYTSITDTLSIDRNFHKRWPQHVPSAFVVLALHFSTINIYIYLQSLSLFPILINTMNPWYSMPQSCPHTQNILASFYMFTPSQKHHTSPILPVEGYMKTLSWTPVPCFLPSIRASFIYL